MKRLGELSLGAAGLASALILALISLDVLLDGRLTEIVANKANYEPLSSEVPGNDQ